MSIYQYFRKNAFEVRRMLTLLCFESVFYGLRRSSQQRGIDYRLPPSWLEKLFNDNLRMSKARLGIRQGGDTRSKHVWSKDELKTFASVVQKSLPLWRFVFRYFQRNEYDQGCSKSIRHQQQFMRLSQECGEVPSDLLERVFERRKKRGGDWTPMAFALDHSRRSIGIKQDYAYNTLRLCYHKAKRLLK